MKSTEYKAEDDSVVKDKNDININGVEDTSEIEGFDFKRLMYVLFILDNFLFF